MTAGREQDARETLREQIAWTETMAAAGWPDPFADDDRMDWEHEREQAYWASPEGVAEQFRQFRAERRLS